MLETRMTVISPKTSSLQNMRIYVSTPLSFHQSITASTNDSAENIATPLPESDVDDEQLRALVASPLYLQEREGNAERSKVYHY